MLSKQKLKELRDEMTKICTPEEEPINVKDDTDKLRKFFTNLDNSINDRKQDYENILLEKFQDIVG